jgi:hypothetical protein
MKTKASVLMAIMLVSVLLAVPTPAQATTPIENLLITADLQIMGNGYAEGNFAISSPLFADDIGSAYQSFKIVGGTVHGIKILIGENGSIVIKFQAQITPLGAVGRFVIITGDGAYANLHGVGTSFATISETGQILATYEGTAHCDPGPCE